MIRSRIAPTPSGFIHLGNAYNFVLTWLLTRSAQGHLMLRIDDLDAARIREEYIEDIFKCLSWLALDWDSGPESIDDVYNIYSQRYRENKYTALLNQLVSKDLVFACTCTRKDLNQPENSFCDCANQSYALDIPEASWRLRIPANTEVLIADKILNKQIINLSQLKTAPILRRKDGIAAYHIASLSDDIENEISLMVRGQDLLESTAIQIYMATQLNNNLFGACTFYHHELIHDEGGIKLSKSNGSTAIKSLMSEQKNPAKFYAWMSQKLGLEEVHSAVELLEAFKADAKFLL